MASLTQNRTKDKEIKAWREYLLRPIPPEKLMLFRRNLIAGNLTESEERRAANELFFGLNSEVINESSFYKELSEKERTIYNERYKQCKELLNKSSYYYYRRQQMLSQFYPDSYMDYWRINRMKNQILEEVEKIQHDRCTYEATTGECAYSHESTINRLLYDSWNITAEDKEIVISSLTPEEKKRFYTREKEITEFVRSVEDETFPNRPLILDKYLTYKDMEFLYHNNIVGWNAALYGYEPPLLRINDIEKKNIFSVG